MRTLRYGALAAVVTIAGLAQAQSANQKAGRPRKADRSVASGAHRAPGPDGKPMDGPQPKGMLIYTRDGHMSVQLMYPKSANAQSNEYVRMGTRLPSGATTWMKRRTR